MNEDKVIKGSIKITDRLDKALSAEVDLSRSRIQALIQEGFVRISGKQEKSAKIKVREGDSSEVCIPHLSEARTRAQNIALDIAFEDEDLIVVNKPAGMVVHPAAGNADGTLVNALLHHCEGRLSGIGGIARPGIVHRIDKDTSGLMVVAKSDEAHQNLSNQFKVHSIQRTYIAICGGDLKAQKGTIETRIGRSKFNRKKMAVLEEGSQRGKKAITQYELIKRLKSASLIKCHLQTGRTHQIRVHCASIGHALLGDPLYGRNPKVLQDVISALDFKRQALHAASLGFVHPKSGSKLMFESSLPADMLELIRLTAR